jgi:uncharacterized membrane protein
MSRKVKILVVASVVLNVLFAGVIIGNMFHQMGRWSAFRHDRALAAKLPPEKYRLFTEVMGGARSSASRSASEFRRPGTDAGHSHAPEFDEQSPSEGETRQLRGQVASNGRATLSAKQFDPESEGSGKYLNDRRGRDERPAWCGPRRGTLRPWINREAPGLVRPNGVTLAAVLVVLGGVWWWMARKRNAPEHQTAVASRGT